MNNYIVQILGSDEKWHNESAPMTFDQCLRHVLFENKHHPDSTLRIRESIGAEEYPLATLIQDGKMYISDGKTWKLTREIATFPHPVNIQPKTGLLKSAQRIMATYADVLKKLADSGD